MTCARGGRPRLNDGHLSIPRNMSHDSKHMSAKQSRSPGTLLLYYFIRHHSMPTAPVFSTALWYATTTTTLHAQREPDPTTPCANTVTASEGSVLMEANESSLYKHRPTKNKSRLVPSQRDGLWLRCFLDISWKNRRNACGSPAGCSFPLLYSVARS